MLHSSHPTRWRRSRDSWLSPQKVVRPHFWCRPRLFRKSAPNAGTSWRSHLSGAVQSVSCVTITSSSRLIPSHWRRCYARMMRQPQNNSFIINSDDCKVYFLWSPRQSRLLMKLAAGPPISFDSNFDHDDRLRSLFMQILTNPNSSHFFQGVSLFRVRGPSLRRAMA
jgi:hypothetical protein